jgi:hypothetical protein
VDLNKNKDVLLDFIKVEQVHMGTILDAQDYLGNWYLAIVIDDLSNGNKIEKKIHFLPFS